jgi:squalene-associated FAD-dependent desaturase
MPSNDLKRIAIIGGGPAGLAAAESLAEGPFEISLFEAGGRLGGRAASIFDKTSGSWIDIGQHAVMGCCDEAIRFFKQTGTWDLFEKQPKLFFVLPGSVAYQFAPSRRLPAPLHLLPALAGLKWLSLRDRCRLALTAVRLAYLKTESSSAKTIGDWLNEQNEPAHLIDQFWSPIFVSALSETIEHASLAAALKVIRDGFFASNRADQLWLPRVPLAHIFDQRIADRLAKRGVQIFRRRPVTKIEADGNRFRQLRFSNGQTEQFDALIVAVPWNRLTKIVDPKLRKQMPELDQLDSIKPSGIAAAHFWFDRTIGELPHAVLVDHRADWLFRPRFGHFDTQPTNGYLQVIKSAANDDPFDLDQLEASLRETFPALRDARRLHRRLTIDRRAVFSVTPEIESIRPGCSTTIDNLLLAGDWTDTGWPSTFEGAIRSGRAAASELVRVAHDCSVYRRSEARFFQRKSRYT